MNQVCLLGRITKDLEVKPTTSSAVVNFTLAVNRSFKREGQPEVDFIGCVAWGKTAEFMGKYMGKGKQIGVTGELQVRTWDDNEGKKHYVTEVLVKNVYFADSKQQSEDKIEFDPTKFSQDDLDLPF